MPLPKSQKTDTTQPVLTIPQARVRMTDVDLHPEPYMVERKSDGEKFEILPNLSCKITIVDDQLSGDHDGVDFFEKFNLKEVDGVWTVKDETKLGNLAKAYYGYDFFEDDAAEFDEEDFEGFEFMAKVQPKKNPTNNQVTGSMLNHETIMAVPRPRNRDQDLALPTTPAQQKADQEEDEDFDNIPF